MSNGDLAERARIDAALASEQAAEYEAHPVTITFTVEPGQTWIDPDGTAWCVQAIVHDTARLERTVVEQRPLLDLVRESRRADE